MKTKNNLSTPFLADVFLVVACLFSLCCDRANAYQRAEILEKAPNFRDLGGYTSGDDEKQTVWRKIFRSQALASLNDSDVEKLRELGVKTVIDFRDDDEVRRAPSRLPDSVNVIRLPIGLGSSDSAQRQLQRLLMSGQLDSVQGVRFMEDANRRLVAEFAPQYKAFFAVLLQPESYPLVFHCTAGKDRTGFAAALLLSALKVEWNTVMEDYLLTNLYLKPQALMPQIPEQALPAMRQIWGVQPSYLNEAKSEIEKRYGSIDSYLQKELNIGEVERERLAGYLLE
ncbi:MAG: tyrosine-protein phosphatase [Prevotellaceae bacterium]|jgi:protein-tyrosine phosphatase|nr:tyrosine-protein phosphatase [Prevotellaceae bacterium]